VYTRAGPLDEPGAFPFNPIGPFQCEGYCRSVAGCNAWTICAAWGPNGAPAGCGSGCLAWGAAHNPDKAGFIPGDCGSGDCVKRGGPRSSSCFCIHNLKLPVEAVGTWPRIYPRKAGAYRGCMPKCAPNGFSWSNASDPWYGFACGSCPSYPFCREFSFTPSDQFAFGMCSLLAVANPTKPTFLPGKLSAGWVSGTFSLPGECAGLSWEACQGCKRAASPDKCRACVRGLKLSLNQQLGMGPLVKVLCKNDKGDGCTTDLGRPWQYHCGIITQKQLMDPNVNTCVHAMERGAPVDCKAQVSAAPSLVLSQGGSERSAG
jgi:hypothetical protein